MFDRFMKYFGFKGFSRKKEQVDLGFEIDDLFPSKINKKPSKTVDPKICDFAKHLQTLDDDIKNVVYSKLLKYLKKENVCPVLVEDVITTNMLPIFVEDLKSTNSSIINHAAAVITYIAKSNKIYIKDIVEAGAIPPFIELLKSDDKNCQKFAIYGLGIICAEDTDYGVFCIQHGIVEPFTETFDSVDNKIYAQNIVGLYIGLCRSALENETILDSLFLLLASMNKLPDFMNHQIFSHIISLIIDFLTAGSQYTLILFDSEVFKLIVESLEDVDQKLRISTYNCLMKFCSSSDKNIEHLINYGLLPATKNIFSKCDLDLKKIILAFLSKAASGKVPQINAIINADFVPLLILLQNSLFSDEEIRQKTLEILSNIVKFGSAENASVLFSEGYISALCKRLDQEDLESVEVALRDIKSFMEKLQVFPTILCAEIVKHGGYDKIQTLQMRPQTGKAANEAMAAFLQLKNESK